MDRDQAYAKQPQLTGMSGFMLVWAGQFVSLLGSELTAFGVAIWLWRETGAATALALQGFFHFLPSVVLSPVAGVIIDRWNRKRVMLYADLGAGLATALTLVLHSAGQLAVWHLYVLTAWSGLMGTFQLPALSAAITTMLPKRHYSRANAMRSLASSAGTILAPILAGILLTFTGIATLLMLDLLTFALAVLTLGIVPIPSLKGSGGEAPPRFWQEAIFGFRYLWERTGLLALTVAFAALNFFGMFGMTVFPTMILARTSGDEAVYGTVLAAIGLGGVGSGLILSIWGGPKRRVHGIVVGILAGSLGLLAFGLGRDVLSWSLAAAFAFLWFPLVGASSAAINQSKVPPHLQGRVFATGRLVQLAGAALAMLLAGPLADHVFGPAMMPGGALSYRLGWLVGVGPGAGMSLMLVISGVLGVLLGTAVLLSEHVRNVEDALPDHEP